MSRFFALVVVLCAMSFAPRANAQLHWDAEAGVGVMHRWLKGSPSDIGGHQPSFGPSAEIGAHIALLPLIRVGGYVGGDVSPWSARSAADPHIDRNATRTAAYGGVQGVVYLPIFPRAMKGWISAGFGGGSVYTRSVRAAGEPPTLLPGDARRFLEVPVGLGVSYTFWKPWSVYAELNGRALFANSAEDLARDAYALGLSAGIMIEL